MVHAYAGNIAGTLSYPDSAFLIHKWKSIRKSINNWNVYKKLGISISSSWRSLKWCASLESNKFPPKRNYLGHDRIAVRTFTYTASIIQVVCSMWRTLPPYVGSAMSESYDCQQKNADYGSAFYIIIHSSVHCEAADMNRNVQRWKCIKRSWYRSTLPPGSPHQRLWPSIRVHPLNHEPALFPFILLRTNSIWFRSSISSGPSTGRSHLYCVYSVNIIIVIIHPTTERVRTHFSPLKMLHICITKWIQ